MTYRPAEETFGPPWSVRFPSIVHVIIAVAVVAVVLLGERSPSGSWLFVYVVEQDHERWISARVLAIALVVSATASILRTNMRGVRIRPDGVEYRDMVSLVVPKVRRFKWPQIDQVILDQKELAFDLWDGSRAHLPPVRDREGLAATLEKVAAARAIPVRGGGHLDEIPDAEDYPDE